MEVRKDGMLLFWQDDTVFSNWYSPAKVTIGYTPLENSEVAFMYLKAAYFKDTDAMSELESCKSPKDAKAIGRSVKNYDDNEWALYRYQVMLMVCELKFTQNEELRQILVNTGDLELVEASPYDKIWGIGLSPTDPHATDKSKWRGQNLLGKALMEIREKIRLPWE